MGIYFFSTELVHLAMCGGNPFLVLAEVNDLCLPRQKHRHQRPAADRRMWRVGPSVDGNVKNQETARAEACFSWQQCQGGKLPAIFLS